MQVILFQLDPRQLDNQNFVVGPNHEMNNINLNDSNRSTVPLTNFQQPMTNYQQPMTNFQQPMTNNQQPMGNFQQPMTNFQQPMTNFQQPMGNFQQPMGNFQPNMPPPDNYSIYKNNLNSRISWTTYGHHTRPSFYACKC